MKYGFETETVPGRSFVVTLDPALPEILGQAWADQCGSGVDGVLSGGDLDIIHAA